MKLSDLSVKRPVFAAVVAMLSIGAGAQQEVAVARREAEVHRAEVEHNAAVGRFMRDKFGTAELYGWMAGQLAGSYFQTYQLAYELARAAERAYQYERGLDGSAVHIRPSYWDSRRSGLP